MIKISEKIQSLINRIKEDLNIPAEIVSELENISNSITILNNIEKIIQKIKDMLIETKDWFILYFPYMIPEILMNVTEIAYSRKKARFVLICKWDMIAYVDLIRKMRMLGNIQFQNIENPFSYCVCSHDSKECLLGRTNETEDGPVAGLYSDENREYKVFLDLSTHLFNISTIIDDRRITLIKKKIKMERKKEKKERKKEKKMKKMYK